MSLSIREITKQDSLFLKGLAICGMLMWHVFYCQNPQGIVYSQFVRYIGAIGDVCVSIFLFISGYGLTVGYSKTESHSIRFILKRLLKFYSNFWFVFLLIVLYGTFVMNQPIKTEGGSLHRVWQYVKEFFAIRGQESYNDSWWYFSLIITFYLIYPLLYWGMKKVPCILIMLTLLGGHFAVGVIEQNVRLYAPIFLIGMAWAMYRKQIPSLSLNTVVILALATLIAPLLMLAFVFDKCDIWKFGIPIYALLTIGMAIFVVTYQNKSKFFKRIFCYLGKYATNIYIIHLMLSKYWYSTLFYKFQSPCLIFLTLLVSSLILSIVIDYIKEYTGYNKMFNFIVKFILK